MTGASPGSRARRDGRTLIESFRLGTVPAPLVTDWTVGRETEVAFIRDWLAMESEGVMVLEGAYGSGKSHLLLYLREKALDMGYAVSYAGFDPSEASAAFPKRTWRKLVRGFRVRLDGRTVDFRAFIERLARASGSEQIDDHLYLGPVLRRVRQGRMRERDWEWLEGRGGVRGLLGSLYDFTTTANIYCYLLSGLGHAAATLLDRRGFLVLLDEAETASALYYSYQYARGLNFFRGLSMTANDEPSLLAEERVRTGGVTTGRETALVYSGHQPVPYVYRISSFLKVAFSLTPGGLVDLFFRWRGSTPILTLEALGPEDLRKILRRFVRTYCQTFDFRLRGRFQESDLLEILEPCLHGPVRTYIKGMTELLDHLRYDPTATAEAVRAATGTPPGTAVPRPDPAAEAGSGG